MYFIQSKPAYFVCSVKNKRGHISGILFLTMCQTLHKHRKDRLSM